MRVVAGSARGLKLNTPMDDRVRPTTDRVKESMFNIINVMVYDSKVLDLFSGSGALGIESLSRGAREAYFCDKSRDSIRVLKSNIEKTKFEDKSKVIMGDFKETLRKLYMDKEKFDLIFVDPPYFEGLFEQVLELIDQYQLLEEDGRIIVEHDAKVAIEEVGHLEKIKEKKYGNTKLTFFGTEEEDD